MSWSSWCTYAGMHLQDTPPGKDWSRLIPNVHSWSCSHGGGALKLDRSSLLLAVLSAESPSFSRAPPGGLLPGHVPLSLVHLFHLPLCLLHPRWPYLDGCSSAYFMGSVAALPRSPLSRALSWERKIDLEVDVSNP